MNGAKGRLGEKITTILSYLPHSISLVDLIFSLLMLERTLESQVTSQFEIVMRSYEPIDSQVAYV
jgi:hypothetical protein